MENIENYATSYEPIFIVCTARSGSTLLRYILDTHKMIDAPQELHLGPLAEEMTKVLSRLMASEGTKKQELDRLVMKEVRSYLERMIRSKLKKKIWCDKSISTIDYLPLLTKIFPKAKYIFLYRDCLDFVCSAMEVSKYGFTGFWYEDFVLKNPENLVDSFVNFWCMQTEKRLILEKENTIDIYPIKYEDIATDTKATISQLFNFLELPYEDKLLEKVFSKHRIGHGDFKIQFTNSIENNTGKGRSVPIKYIKDDTFKRMNGLLEKLGYKKLSKNWNFENDSPTPVPDDFSVYIINKIQSHLTERLQKNAPPEMLQSEILQLKVTGIDTFPWVLDFKAQSCLQSKNYKKPFTIEVIVKFDTLLEIINKTQNVSMSFRNGDMTHNGSYEVFHYIGNYLFG